MRQKKSNRIVIAFVSGLVMGSLPMLIQADDPKALQGPLEVPTLTPNDLATPPADPKTQKQFGRALSGEAVLSDEPALQDALNVVNQIGSVLEGSSLDARNFAASPPSNDSPIRANNGRSPRTQPPTVQDSHNPNRAPSNRFPAISGSPRDRDTMPAPRLVPRPVRPTLAQPSQPGNQDDRFYTAELLLRTARLLGEVSPSDPSRQQLVASMRAEAVRLMSSPRPPSPLPVTSATYAPPSSLPPSGFVPTPPSTLAPPSFVPSPR